MKFTSPGLPCTGFFRQDFLVSASNRRRRSGRPPFFHKAASTVLLRGFLPLRGYRHLWQRDMTPLRRRVHARPPPWCRQKTEILPMHHTLRYDRPHSETDLPWFRPPFFSLIAVYQKKRVINRIFNHLAAFKSTVIRSFIDRHRPWRAAASDAWKAAAKGTGCTTAWCIWGRHSRRGCPTRHCNPTLAP